MVEYISGNYDIFTTEAVNTAISGFGSIFIAVAMFLFTFTTIMAYSMYLSRIYYYFFSDHIENKSVSLSTLPSMWPPCCWVLSALWWAPLLFGTWPPPCVASSLW